MTYKLFCEHFVQSIIVIHVYKIDTQRPPLALGPVVLQCVTMSAPPSSGYGLLIRFLHILTRYHKAKPFFLYVGTP